MTYNLMEKITGFTEVAAIENPHAMPRNPYWTPTTQAKHIVNAVTNPQVQEQISQGKGEIIIKTPLIPDDYYVGRPEQPTYDYTVLRVEESWPLLIWGRFHITYKRAGDAHYTSLGMGLNVPHHFFLTPNIRYGGTGGMPNAPHLQAQVASGNTVSAYHRAYQEAKQNAATPEDVNTFPFRVLVRALNVPEDAEETLNITVKSNFYGTPVGVLQLPQGFWNTRSVLVQRIIPEELDYYATTGTATIVTLPLKSPAYQLAVSRGEIKN